MSKTNHLINEKSPYLLQHAYNPVNWYPWCDEAFQLAQQENKPVFLSIGYSTCHWCHVMEQESFEDQEVAELLNKSYISIKVDREERPDIDSVYMNVCQAFTGHGGWPLTVVLTPEKTPLFAGTYFPKHSRGPSKGLIEILKTISSSWLKDQDRLREESQHNLSIMADYFLPQANPTKLTDDLLQQGRQQLIQQFDHKNGGFGQAPKFPTPHKIMFLLTNYRLNNDEQSLSMAEFTLQQMYKGGIFDHLGYGFSRYSTDNVWLIPHFEKMLYDNGLLIYTYAQAFSLTQNSLSQEIVNKTICYIKRNLTSAEGGFYSAEDADSEGEEGKFYTFSLEEIINQLGEEDGKYFAEYYGVTERGNFEGKTVLNRIGSETIHPEDPKIQELRTKLLPYRQSRYSLHKDDKILTSWNGLMIAGLAKAYQSMGIEEYLDLAQGALSFIEEQLTDQSGRLLARYREGEAKHLAYLDDYAFLIWALFELYKGTLEVSYLEKAKHYTQAMIELFWDDEDGGFFFSGKDGEQLIAKSKDLYDGAMPAGNWVACYCLLKLSSLLGSVDYHEKALTLLENFSGVIAEYPSAHCFALIALQELLYPAAKLVIVTDQSHKDFQHLAKDDRDLLVQTPDNKETWQTLWAQPAYDMLNQQTTYYLCKGQSCFPPSNELPEVGE